MGSDPKKRDLSVKTNEQKQGLAMRLTHGDGGGSSVRARRRRRAGKNRGLLPAIDDVEPACCAKRPRQIISKEKQKHGLAMHLTHGDGGGSSVRARRRRESRPVAGGGGGGRVALLYSRSEEKP